MGVYEKAPSTQRAKKKSVIAIETFRSREGKFALRRGTGRKKGRKCDPEAKD
jgi:hypothetical protein